MIGVVVSQEDSASVHIGQRLQANAEWDDITDPSNPVGWGDTGYRRSGITIREFEDLHLHLDNVAAAFQDPSLVVFASRHSGETGPLLSTHFTGNLGTAAYGGEPRTLAQAAPNAAREIRTALATHAPPAYDVTFECTHHGPSHVGAPSLFVEVGSDSQQWEDAAAADAVASAILDLVNVSPLTERTVVTIGESHYAPRATRIVQDTDWAVGHIASDWALEELDDPTERILEQLFTCSGARHAVVDDTASSIKSMISELGYSVVSERWVNETSGVPLERVESLEAQICPVDDGLRFGELAGRVESVAIVELPTPVLEAANNVSVERTRQAVAEVTVAFATSEGRTRVASTVAVPDEDGIDPMIAALLTVLETGYDTVERTEDAVILTETVFDPAAARSYGVPEGPKFGRLAAGESVTIDGTTIEPEMVTTQETIHLPL